MDNFNFEISSIIKDIIELEFKNGNKIAETSKGWPEKESILIILEKPFSKKYKKESLEYRFINDSHYWKEEC